MPLPGEASHLKMAPEFRARELKEAKAAINLAKQAAVMALFYPRAKWEVHLLLILRKSHPKDVHSNQVGLPGGKVEKQDANRQATALRETFEEVGISSEKIEVVRRCTPLYIPPSNFQVHPFMGLIDYQPEFIAQVSEVAALIEVPLSELLNDNNLVTKRLTTSYASQVEVPAFLLQGRVVWGATGMMLNEIRSLIKLLL